MKKWGTLLACSAVMLAGCGGGVASQSAADAGEGVEFGASIEEYQEALSDMEPVELTYQGGGSPTGYSADREREFAERITEWSGGKITFDLQWGQAIASYDQVTEAVAAGMIDIALEVPLNSPEKYPAINALVDLSPAQPTSPYLSEIISAAALQQVAFETPEVVDETASMGVTPLVPVEFEFTDALMCSTSVTSADDFDGRQIRVGAQKSYELMQAAGAAPVSMPYTETYEALQRNVADCTLNGMKVGINGGFLEVAPEITFPSDVSWGRDGTILVAGGKYDDLPLAGKQLIFDSLAYYFEGQLNAGLNYAADGVAAAEAQSGGFNELETDVEDKIREQVEVIRAEVGESRAVDGKKMADDVDSALAHWTDVAEELGYEDVGDWEDLKSVEDNPIDFQPFAERVFEEIYLPHRPR
ncbi:type 2 periplasmic-binding domain-containing protein [Brevibacterium senegalense]|uniref:hypothetical protein n=1 Tax=Brevibacterium senegalense TaxID=1033736 RepID=UPI0011C755F9|nr:hypothetical protein [Brevibacterium senegalense]